MSLVGLNVEVKTQTVSFKALAPDEWPAMSKTVRKFHEHTRCRGFTPEEIRFFKSKDKWKHGAFVDVPEPKS